MRRVYIVAGGTGGHINAALSMGEELNEYYEITYLTGQRYLDYQLFKNKNAIHLDSRSLRSKSFILKLKSLFLNLLVLLKLLSLYLFKRPAFVLGAGGYVCGPALLSAKMLGIKVFIIEQNAVVGLTNKILAKFSDRIFTNFEQTKGLERVSLEKIKAVGNPIRKSIEYYPNIKNDEKNILIFGGSLGATQINQAVQILLDQKKISHVNILHQTGRGNVLEYDELISSFTYEQREFIEDMNEAYRWSNLIIARAGASTVSELRIIRKPSILIPFPGATDNHQYHNAKNLEAENVFPCQVIDHKLQGEDLAIQIQHAIEAIDMSSSSEFSIQDEESASSKIRKEIQICLK